MGAAWPTVLTGLWKAGDKPWKVHTEQGDSGQHRRAHISASSTPRAGSCFCSFTYAAMSSVCSAVLPCKHSGACQACLHIVKGAVLWR